MSVLDGVLLVSGLLAMIIGFLGAVLPVLPWPMLSLVGFFLIQAMQDVQFSLRGAVLFTVLVLISMVIDYYLPIWWTKRYGGTKRGMIWSLIGMVFGFLFFPPLGIILLPCLWVFIGEYFISGLHGRAALNSARWSFMGFVLGTWYKLIVCAWILFYTISKVWNIYF